MIALTYAEAQARSRLIEVLGYHVELDVTGGDDIFESVTVVRFGCRAPGTDTFIEIRPARLRGASKAAALPARCAGCWPISSRTCAARSQ